MGSCITTPRPALTARTRRQARSTLGLASLAGLVAACSVAPAEETAHSSAAITGNLITRSSPDGQITNGNGGCLDLPNGDTTNGNLLHIWACDGGWNQTWFVNSKGSIHYAANPTKCVDFPAQGLVNGVPTDETQLQLWDCNGASGPDQVWQFSWTGQIQFAADTAKCIELRNGGYPFVDGSAQNGTAVQVYDCVATAGPNGQTWALLSGGVQGFQLQDGNGECLDEGAGAASGTKVGLATCNSTGANQTWCMDGTGALFNCVSHLYVTSPSLSPLTQLVLSGPLPSAYTTLSNSNHNLLVGGNACVGPENTPSLSTPVIAYGCNGSTLETWFPRPVGGSCPGTVASDGTCVACGANNQLPCTAGCNPGTVTAIPPGGVGTICVSACGNVGQYPCTSGGCTGGCYDFGGFEATRGPCTGPNTDDNRVILAGDDIVDSSAGVCEINPSCGHNGVGCCNAGSFFGGSGDCFDGSACNYSGFPGAGSWQCQGPSPTSPSSPPPPPPPICSGGGELQALTVCCGSENLTYDLCNYADAIAEGESQTGLGCVEGECPRQSVRGRSMH